MNESVLGLEKARRTRLLPPIGMGQDESTGRGLDTGTGLDIGTDWTDRIEIGTNCTESDHWVGSDSFTRELTQWIRDPVQETGVGTVLPTTVAMPTARRGHVFNRARETLERTLIETKEPAAEVFLFGKRF
jgi:hypothetical protein